VIGHEAYLTQCVTNLLGNAVKFVPAGVIPEILIHSERLDGKVRVWFEDNGIVVVLTSFNEPGDLSKSYALGANSYLVKPPTAEQLEDMATAFKWYWLEYNRFSWA